MASVVGKTKKQTTVLMRIGRCLRGLIDGKAVYRYVRENPRPVGMKSNSLKAWMEDGFYSRNLLDE
jgi:hypothetical protein